MMRALSVLGAACSIALCACGTTTDERPETEAYVTEAILAPYCGRATCHSSTTREHGFVFDTAQDALPSLRALVVPGHAAGSELITVQTSSDDIMPPDMPLPDADFELLTRWIDDGASGL